MEHRWKRTLAGTLSCALALTLTAGLACVPASAAGPKEVYQGDGYYITVTKYGNQNLELAIDEPFSDGLIRYYDRDVNSHGFADKNGNIVVSAQTLADKGYEQKGFDGLFSNGLLAVEAEPEEGVDDSYSGAHYGYINRDVELVIPSIYRSAAPFVDGVALVKSADSLYRHVRKNGAGRPRGREICPL